RYQPPPDLMQFEEHPPQQNYPPTENYSQSYNHPPQRNYQQPVNNFPNYQRPRPNPQYQGNQQPQYPVNQQSQYQSQQQRSQGPQPNWVNRSYALPLHNLTKKDVPFVWGEDEETTFQTLKDAMVNAPVLDYFDAEASIRIVSDASGYRIGATCE
ncbi:unnamed protein product, partial [Allacma fusca]